MHHIETIGATACGKSTILQELEAQRTVNNNWVMDPAKHPNAGPWQEPIRPSDRSQYIQRNLEFVAFASRALVSTIQNGDDEKYANIFNRSARLNEVFAKLENARQQMNNGELLIVDEGLVQHARFLLNPKHTLETTKETLLKPQLAVAYIVVEADEETIMRRLQAREKKVASFINLNESQTRKITTERIELIEENKRLIADVNIPYISVDATLDPAYNAQRLLVFVEEIYKQIKPNKQD